MFSFKLKNILNIAKRIRDTKMHPDCRKNLVRGLHELFYEDNPVYDSFRFKQIALGEAPEESYQEFLKQRKIKL